MIKKFNFIDIVEINAPIYYHLIQIKKTKLFSLIINKIYNILNEPFKIISQLQRDNRISINKLYLYDFETKYKKCYELYISKNAQINNIEILTSQKMLNKFLINYHNYINFFDRSQTNVLFSHRFYNHKLKFAKKADKNTLFKNRIYSLSNHKFEQIKKYLNKHFKKGFIVFNYTLFTSFILFTKKSNENLRFYVNYRKLNVIIKRNRYFISLINEILIKIQDCKYFTRFDIIVIFNKFRMHLDSEDFITFITSLKTYKYRMLSFELTNNFIIYQQYMNNIFFKYLNNFY